MELESPSSSTTSAMGASLTKEPSSSSPIDDHHRQSFDAINNQLNSLSIVNDNISGEGSGPVEERENNRGEGGDRAEERENNGGEGVGRAKETENNGGEGGGHAEERESSGGEGGDRVEESENNGGEVGDRAEERENYGGDFAEERENDVGEDGDFAEERENDFGEDGDRSEERENNAENFTKIEEEREDGGIRRRSSSRSRFPVRPEAEDCSFYVRTGACKFGMNCKFNHPPHLKKFQGVKVKSKEEFDDYGTHKLKEKDEVFDKENIDCKYFDRPGGCKFGKACKFNHNRKANATSTLNFMGLPIRLGEKECPFYMRNGSCKFGANCRFNHPDPTSIGGPEALPNYDDGGASQSTLAPWSPPTAINENPPFVPLMFSPTQGVPTPSEWNAYQAPVYPPERSMHIPPTYAMNNKLPERPELGDEFPERPGQPECSYFVKTGNCRYKSACKFHHPKSAMGQSPSYLLSDLGLPLRPGENVCSYYIRYGICKYGPACKYDHPIHYAHSSNFTVSAVDSSPILGASTVNNQAMAAGS